MSYLRKVLKVFQSWVNEQWLGPSLLQALKSGGIVTEAHFMELVGFGNQRTLPHAKPLRTLLES